MNCTEPHASLFIAVILQSFFFFHGILKLIECFYQLPSVAGIVANTAQQQHLAISLAVASFVCWKAPGVLQKKKIA